MAIVAFPEHPFDEIAWKDDRLQLRDLVFEVEGRARAQRSSGEAGFVLLKPKRVIDQYAQSVSV